MKKSRLTKLLAVILSLTIAFASFGAVTNCRYDGNGCGKGGGAPKEDSITHVIHYWPKGKCSVSEGIIDYDGSQNNIAIAYYLEGGAIYCGDNQ